VEWAPNHAFAYVYIAAIHYLVYGQVDESLIWYQKAVESDVLSPSLAAAQVIAYLELGDPDSARVFADRALKMSATTFWPLRASLLLNIYVGDAEAAERDARALLEVNPRFYPAHNYLRNVDIANGRYEAAAARYARAFQRLTEYEKPVVDRTNYVAAVDLALVMKYLGQHERAADLLDGALVALEEFPRLGTTGYWIADVQAYALQDKTEMAISALRDAVDEGWRIFSWYYLDHSPNLESIRGDPEFQRLRRRIREDMAVQAIRAEELRASGDLRL
jgi:tetratricopeptide (TPR) repeat protein